MIAWLTGTTVGKFISTFFISMVPVVELRLGLPYGIALGLPYGLALTAAILGNMLPVPFIIIYIRRIFAWLRRHWEKLNGFLTSLERRAEGKGEKVQKYGTWGLLILVAIPLPGTGAWMGSLVAALLNLKARKATPVIFVGVCIAAAIMTAVTYGAIHIF
jgi:uncharacterized membrane protein